MRHTDNCDLCGESYSEDNLGECATCSRSFCYRCGSGGRCKRCAEAPAPAPKPAPDPRKA